MMGCQFCQSWAQFLMLALGVGLHLVVIGVHQSQVKGGVFKFCSDALVRGYTAYTHDMDIIYPDENIILMTIFLCKFS